jgi:hypothetical protein
MSYPAVADRNSGRQRGQNGGGEPPIPVRRPLFHLPYLYRLSFFIDWKAIKPAATRTEVFDFILRSLKVPAMEVISSYTDNVTQLQLVTVEAEPIYQEALAALRAGVPWAAAGGRPR